MERGLRNVIPTYGTTGLTDEIITHLVECRVKRVVLMLDADEAGRAAAIEMAQRLAAVNIEARAVELPTKDAAEFIASGRTADDMRQILTPPTTTTNKPGPALQMETSADGSMLFAIDGREYRIRGLSPVGLERLRVNVRLTINGAFHLDTIDLYQARARAVFAQGAAKLCGAGEQQVTGDLLQMIEQLEAARLAMRKNGDEGNKPDAPMTPQSATWRCAT